MKDILEQNNKLYCGATSRFICMKDDLQTIIKYLGGCLLDYNEYPEFEEEKEDE